MMLEREPMAACDVCHFSLWTIMLHVASSLTTFPARAGTGDVVSKTVPHLAIDCFVLERKPLTLISPTGCVSRGLADLLSDIRCCSSPVTAEERLAPGRKSSEPER